MRVIRRRIIIPFYELYDVVPYSSYTTGNAGGKFYLVLDVDKKLNERKCLDIESGDLPFGRETWRPG